jgi:hypothetical protein
MRRPRCRGHEFAIRISDEQIARPVEDDASARPVFIFVGPHKGAQGAIHGPVALSRRRAVPLIGSDSAAFPPTVQPTRLSKKSLFAPADAAIPQNAGLRKSVTRFKNEDLNLLPQSNSHQSCTERSCVQAMCCKYRLLNQRHYAFNCKRVDLSADVPYLQHRRLLLSLPSRSWLPPCRRGSELHLGGIGIGETGIEPGVDKRFQKGLCTIHRRVSPFSCSVLTSGLTREGSGYRNLLLPHLRI